GREPEQDNDENRGNRRQDAGHRDAYCDEIGDGAGCGHTRRQHVPHEQVFNGEGGVGCGGDAAGQGAGEPFGEIAWRMAGEMAEQLAAQIATHTHKSVTGDPSPKSPEEIVGSDQADQNNECCPDAWMCAALVECIDQEFDGILGADGAANGTENSEEDGRMCQRPTLDIPQQERNGASSVVTEAEHRHTLMLYLAIRRQEEEILAVTKKSLPYGHRILP